MGIPNIPSSFGIYSGIYPLRQGLERASLNGQTAQIKPNSETKPVQKENEAQMKGLDIQGQKLSNDSSGNKKQEDNQKI